MAPRDTKSEAFQAGQENPYIGAFKPLQFLNALPSAIGAEISGSDMGTPVGTKFKAHLKQSGAYAKRLEELRAKHPEEFGRGQMMAQQAADPYELGLGLGTLGGMTPYGRTSFEMAGGGEVPEGIFRNPELGYSPRAPRGRGPGPEGPTINAGFDVPRGMNRFEANQYYMTHGIPGEDIYYRSNPAMPLPTSRNAFEEASVLAANRTRPSPAPANYDYMGPSAPGPVSQRPMSDFDRASMGANWSGQGKGQYGRFVPGQRTGPGAVPLDYTLDELGQAVGPAMGRGMVPYRAQTQVQPQGVGGANYPYRPGPVGFQLLPPYERGGLPTMARSGEIPYGEFRDVTGHVLPAPPPGAAPRYTGSMDFGVTREGPATERAGLHPVIKALIAGAAADAGLRGGYNAMFGGGEQNPLTIDYRGFGMRGRDGMATPRLTDFYPIEPMAMAPQGGMEALPVTAPPSTPAAAARTSSTSTARTAKAKTKAEPMPPRRPADLAADPAWEGNLNYYVTQALDRLTGQDEANAGRRYQEYYATHPWPY